MQPVALTDDLVVAAAAGDTEGQHAVLAALLPQVRMMIHARLHPSSAQHHLMDDLVQQAMTEVSAGLRSLQRQTATGLRAFTSTIASRLVARAIAGRGPFRKAAARSLDSAVIDPDPSVAGPMWSLLSAGGKSPATQADNLARIQQILEELHHLKDEHREVITLAFFDQLETRDIAEHLGISRPAASMLLVRAVNTLRRNLTGSSKVLHVENQADRSRET